MCFSAKASIISLCIGVIGAFMCTTLGTIADKIMGFFMIFVSLMQGIEYLLWTHQKRDAYNRVITILGMLFNHFQPIVLGLLILTMNPLTIYKNWIYYILFIFSCVIIPHSFRFLMDAKQQYTMKNTTHLSWEWNHVKYSRFVYPFFLFSLCILFLLGIPDIKYGFFFALVAFITFFSSLLFYKSKFIGALWCYYVVFLPLVYYLIRIIYEKVQQPAEKDESVGTVGNT